MVGELLGSPKLEPQKRTVQARGIEYLAASKLTELGYLVSLPSKGTSYDLIVGSEAQLFKVEVKYATIPSDRNTASVTVGTGKNRDEAARNHFDLLLVKTRGSENDWYLIPVEEVEGKVNIGVGQSTQYSRYIIDI